MVQLGLLEGWSGLWRVHAANLQQRSFCQTLGLGRASSDSGSLFDLGQVNLVALSYAQISMCKTGTMLLPFSLLFGSLVSCVSDIPAEIRTFLCHSNRYKLGASEITASHPGLLSQNPPPLPCVYGWWARDKTENKQDKRLIVRGLLQAQERPKTIGGVIEKF